MKKRILLVVLNLYSDWEAAYLSSFINLMGKGEFLVETVSTTKNPIKSLGSFTVLPDYDVQSVPEDYEAVILIGGMSWREEEAKMVVPLVEDAVAKHKIIGAICDSTVFIGGMGLLNNVNHTSNDLDDLKQWAGIMYTGEAKYIKEPAVSDQKIITANGTATLEFTREVLKALKIAPEELIEGWCRFHKLGCYKAAMPVE